MTARGRAPTPVRRLARALLLCGLGVAVLAVTVVAVLAVVWARADLDTTGRGAQRPLVIPPLAAQRTSPDGARTVRLRLQEGSTDLGGGARTPTWGVNQGHLGETVRLHRGERVAMEVANDLPEATTLHWHGMHLPAVADGGPHQTIRPGGTWRPSWTVDQPAATLWYHPHLHGTTAEHVQRGAAGMIIVDDGSPAARDLPSDYAVDDVPLLLQDLSLDDASRLHTSAGPFAPAGPLGDVVTVNGTPDAYLPVTTQRVRLRLVNASLARSYAVGLRSGGQRRQLDLVGTDGGLLERPVALDRVPLAPGERAEVVVTLAPGERAVLDSGDVDLGLDPWTARFSGADDRLDLLELRAAPTLVPSPDVPSQLAPAPASSLPLQDATRTRSFELLGYGINGATMDMARVDEVVAAGAVEVWEVTNADGAPHSLHVHDVQFRVLDVGGDDPVTWGGWKDTVVLRPQQRVRLLMRFGEDVDPLHPYMFHCHQLQHEDRGMMGQFLVVDPDRVDATSRTLATGAHQDG